MASITDLAARIQANTTALNDFINSNGLRQPSFAPDADEEFPNPQNDQDIEKIRMSVLEDTNTLYNLIQGPMEIVRRICWGVVDATVQRIIYDFNILEAVPLEGGASYEEIAAKIGLPEARVKSVLRQSMLNHIFEESKPNQVTHTASSAGLLRNKGMLDFYGHNLNQTLQAGAKLSDALQKYPASGEPQDSAFGLAFDTEDGMFGYYDKHRDLQARFFGAMAGSNGHPRHSLDHVVKGFDWNKFSGGHVVDVGGSTGLISTAVAEAYPTLSFTVQDYEETVKAGEASLPEHLKGRVNYATHNFFNKQTVEADVYVLRHICHNWSDDNSAKILRRIVPAMKPTSRILLIDAVLWPPNVVSNLEERHMRGMDIVMLSMLNTCERGPDEWKEVVTKTDPRLTIHGITTPPGSVDSFIEIGFKST